MDALRSGLSSSVSKAETASASWPAHLQLQFEQRSGNTRLSRARHQGPLYVQKPFYPEGGDLAHVYLLHPPGGIVSGDALEIDINVGTEAKALVTTPGAARIYRARENHPLQRQNIHLQVADGGSIEWFPLETIVYSGSCVELETCIDLAATATAVAWEITCFGLPASDEPFVTGSFRQRYLLRQDGRPIFLDQLHIDDSNRHLLHSRIGMAGFPVTGFLLLGPFAGEDTAILMEQLRELALQHELQQVGAISRVGDWLIGRYLGDSAEQARKLFTLWWQQVRPLMLSRQACAPRIWLT